MLTLFRDLASAISMAGIEFFTELYYDKVTERRYSAIKTAPSALSSVLPLEFGKSFGEHLLVHDFMCGVHNLRPPWSKYVSIKGPKQVLILLNAGPQ